MNVQTFLQDMRDEMRENHEKVMAKIDEVKDDVSSHETRITVIEGQNKLVRWLAGTALGGLIMALITRYVK